MLAVGQGAQDTITGSISGIGTNLLFVFEGNLEVEVRNPKPLTLSDSQALQDKFQAPSVEDVSAAINGSVDVVFDAEQTNTTVTGITPNYQTMRNYVLIEGVLYHGRKSVWKRFCCSAWK